MLRVYLDQNKWVDLARATTGHRLGAPFKDALAVCRAGVAAGTVSFPLDMYRYWETGKRGDNRSRHDVTDVMRDLSRQHTIATPFSILDREIDLALQRRFGLPHHPRQAQVFGIGMRHIAGDKMDWPGLNLTDHPELEAALPPGARSQLDHFIHQLIETQLLRTGPEDYRKVGFNYADSDHADRYVEGENKIAEAIQQYGLKGDAIEVAVRAADCGDISPAIATAAERIGMTREQVISHLIETKGLMSFMDDLPTRYVTNVLRSAKHRQAQLWEPNDFIDIVALPVPAVYCDVVVTEKRWVDAMRRGRVPERYSTIVISDVAALAEVIVSASAA